MTATAPSPGVYPSHHVGLISMACTTRTRLFPKSPDPPTNWAADIATSDPSVPMRTRPTDGRRATSTAQGAWSTTSAETEPRNASSIAPCPRAPTMIRSAPISRATSDDDRGSATLDQSGLDIEPGPPQSSGSLDEKRRTLGPQIVPQRLGGHVGDAGGPRTAIPVGLRREDCQDQQLGTGGHAKLAAVSSPNANSVDPSIASNAFIRDSFAEIVVRASHTHMCQSDGPCRTVGPFV